MTKLAMERSPTFVNVPFPIILRHDPSILGVPRNLHAMRHHIIPNSFVGSPRLNIDEMIYRGHSTN